VVEAMVSHTASRRLVVSRPAGLHARPCLAIVNTVRQFQSEVEVRSGHQKADAREILQLLSLGATQGTELTFSARGPDADQVLEALARLFADDFGLSDEA